MKTRPLSGRRRHRLSRSHAVASPEGHWATPAGLKPRLLGNSAHAGCTTSTTKPGCRIAEIRPDQRFYFKSTDQAEKLGCDCCAHCFGTARSKR